MQQVVLDDSEVQRLRRILAVTNLDAQRRIAYPFWILGAVLHVVGFVMVVLGSIFGIALVSIGFATLMIGMARYGYYKIFRMLHYMAETCQVPSEQVPHD